MVRRLGLRSLLRVPPITLISLPITVAMVAPPRPRIGGEFEFMVTAADQAGSGRRTSWLLALLFHRRWRVIGYEQREPF